MLVDSAVDEALVVFSHLLLYKGVQIVSTHINLYIRLLPGFQMPRIFLFQIPVHRQQQRFRIQVRPQLFSVLFPDSL